MAGRTAEDEPRPDGNQSQVDDVHALKCPHGQRSAHDERDGAVRPRPHSLRGFRGHTIAIVELYP